MKPAPVACLGQVDGSQRVSLKVSVSPALMLAMRLLYQPCMASTTILVSRVRAAVRPRVENRALTGTSSLAQGHVDQFLGLRMAGGVEHQHAGRAGRPRPRGPSSAGP